MNSGIFFSLVGAKRFLFIAVIFLISCGNDRSISKQPSADSPTSDTFETKNVQVAKDGRTSFEFFFKQDGKLLDHQSFLRAMANNESDFTLKTMRGFARLIEHFKLDKCGFLTTADPKDPAFHLVISGNSKDSCAGSINPLMTYNKNNDYEKILHGNEHADNRVVWQYAVAFNSRSMAAGGKIKRLIIPKGPYVTIWNFAKDADADELRDFFRLVKEEVERLFLEPGRAFSYEVHSGSQYYQAVAHFHLRVYEL